MESILGIQAPCLVPGHDTALDDGGICSRVVRRGAGAEPNKPTSRNWLSYLCYGHFPGSVGLAYT